MNNLMNDGSTATLIGENFINQATRSAELDRAVTATFDRITRILVRSYGPLGGSAIIDRPGAMAPEVSKDGLTILRNIPETGKAIEDNIFKLIHSISSKLVDTVGDGSTSAVLAASALYSSLGEHLKDPDVVAVERRLYIKVLNIVQELLVYVIENYLVKELPSSMQERQSILSKIATISNNNDFSLGDRVAAVMINATEHSSVKIEASPFDGNPSIHEKLVQGFSLTNHMLHPMYFPKAGVNEFVLTKPIIVVTEALYEPHYEVLLQYVNQLKRPLIIVVNSISEAVQSTILKSTNEAISMNAIPPITLVQVPSLSSNDAMDGFLDLAIYTDADAMRFPAIGTPNAPEVDTMEQFLSLIGECDTARFTKGGAILLEGGAGYKRQTEDYNQLLNTLRDDYAKIPVHHKLARGKLRGRINKLSGLNITIYVCGRTEEEKTSLKYLVEDSVLACQSTIKHGYIVGGNVVPAIAAMLLDSIADHGSEGDSFIYDRLDSLVKETSPLSLELFYKVIYSIRDAYSGLVIEQVSRYFSDEFVDLIEEPISTGRVSVEVQDAGGQDGLVQQQLPMIYSYCPTAKNVKALIPIIDATNGELTKYSVNNMQLGEPLYDDARETSVLSSAKTDVEILKAAFSIITIFLSSNQFLGRE